ncbi:MAG: hypothetical protein ACREIF_04070 [Chthoniobacterales bacterium]
MSSQSFPTDTYVPRYYDSNLTDLGTVLGPNAVYQLQITIAPYPTPTPFPPPIVSAQFLLNADVHYPANAPAANQSVARFTTLMFSQ